MVPSITACRYFQIQWCISICCPSSIEVCMFYTLTVHVTVHAYGSGRLCRTQNHGVLRKKFESWIRMSRHRGKDGMLFQHGGGNVSQAWNLKKYQLLPKQVYLWGFLLRKNRSSHRSVRICLGIGRVAGSTVSSTITKSKVSCFVADLFGVDAGNYM